ncbi:MFS transporter [Sporothrix schenckii 1099-18]|uniref:MFS transporter n=1 Tax=Sporothrix schenckii 1099-18 TaxID=1397361 RepID=A0A0F2MBD8_SPOSC|nr:MFS transporter [Sporothrix schenckii 1099-18]KJR86145.1 MFS transporter [Sporothrix schenckii 1099-18]
MADHTVDEQMPLLGAGSRRVPPADAAAAPSHQTASSSPAACLQRLAHRVVRLTIAERVVLVDFVFIFIVQLGAGTAIPAISSMIEAIICRQRFGDTLVVGPGGSGRATDPRCKAPDIQGRLSQVLGWQTALECIPNILFSLPYGILADNLGRKPVLLLAWSGLTLQFGWYLTVFYFTSVFPLWTLRFSLLFESVGCFQAVGPAMAFTVLADVTPQAERANRYFRLTAVFLVAELIGNPLSGTLLLWGGHWMPLMVALVALLVSGLVLLLLPETLHFDPTAGKAAAVGSAETASGLAASDSDTYADDDPPPSAVTISPPPKRSKIGSAWQRFLHLLRTDARATSLFMLRNRPLLLLVVPFVSSTVARFAQTLLLQYATERYAWSWSQAAFLLTIGTTTNLVLCLVLLPLASTVLLKSGSLFGIDGSSLRKDLWIARVSGTLIVFGALLIAFAVTPWLLSVALVVFSLGGGYSPAMRSLLNAFVEPHHLAMLNTLLGLLEYSGVMVTAPVLFGALQRGVVLGGPWAGLPFIIAAGVCFVGTFVVVVFRIPLPMLQKETDVAAETEARRQPDESTASSASEPEVV